MISLTRMKVLTMAGGWLVVGAMATAQQAERPRRARSTVPPPAAGSRAATYIVNPAQAVADPEIEKEIRQLEVSLLDEEVKLLHDSATAALKEILAYRTSTTTADPRASADAEAAYLKARETYLSRARDLAIAKKKLDPAGTSTKAADPKAADPKAADAAPKDAGSGGGVRIGSVNLEVIQAWYAKRPRQATNALEELRQAIGLVARTKGLDLVVRSMHGSAGEASLQVLYAAPRIDITEDVLRELNGRDPAERKTP